MKKITIILLVLSCLVFTSCIDTLLGEQYGVNIRCQENLVSFPTAVYGKNYSVDGKKLDVGYHSNHLHLSSGTHYIYYTKYNKNSSGVHINETPATMSITVEERDYDQDFYVPY